ncbi:hypothetical protein BDW74DRAFT_77043 [Aspergillus multicolor]|uniref:uncharacterized protein n=1 Tax=Aspergillus multicolor TaxID=41759 RepID=UPI003CCDA85A
MHCYLGVDEDAIVANVILRVRNSPRHRLCSATGICVRTRPARNPGINLAQDTNIRRRAIKFGSREELLVYMIDDFQSCHRLTRLSDCRDRVYRGSPNSWYGVTLFVGPAVPGRGCSLLHIVTCSWCSLSRTELGSMPFWSQVLDVRIDRQYLYG